MLEDAFRIWNHDRPTLLREAAGLAALCVPSSPGSTFPSSPERSPARGALARILPVRLTCRLS